MSNPGDEEISKAILRLVPPDGSSIGNIKLMGLLRETWPNLSDEDYFRVRDALVAEGVLATGRGRGGSVMLAEPETAETLELTSQEQPKDLADLAHAASKKKTKKKAGKKKTHRKAGDDAEVLSYRHADKRINNPEVGMVDPDTDPAEGKARWAYDPHIDPALQFDIGRAEVEKIIDDALASGDEQAMREALATLKRMSEPYLNWTGKAERTSFDVDLVSLHVHERIDPASILKAVRKRMKKGEAEPQRQADMFKAWFEEPLPYREAIDFYKHDRGWANRLISGDSLQVMNSLIQKEGMAGQVQMIYIDPPYGIKYGSNFQPFTNKRDVKDRSDQDLTQEPEMIKAFRDTWELGVHSYLTYLRDRICLSHELLRESGSICVQISEENLHRVRGLLEEIFGSDNFVSQISYSTTTGTADSLLGSDHDYILWFAKSKKFLKYRQQWLKKDPTSVKSYKYKYSAFEKRYAPLRAEEKETRKLNPTEEIAQFSFVVSQDPGDLQDRLYQFEGLSYDCGASRHWKTTNPTGLNRLDNAGRLIGLASQLNYIRFFKDFPLSPLKNVALLHFWWVRKRAKYLIFGGQQPLRG